MVDGGDALFEVFLLLRTVNFCYLFFVGLSLPETNDPETDLCADPVLQKCFMGGNSDIWGVSHGEPYKF